MHSRRDIRRGFVETTGLALAVMLGVAGCFGSSRDAPARSVAVRPEMHRMPGPFPSSSAPEPDTQRGFATFYGAGFTGRKTANGERYDPLRLTAAHRSLPFGSMVDVVRADGRHVVVRINDRGPYGGNDRIIDLSRRAAEELGMIKEGKIPVELRPVSDVWNP